MTTAVFPSTSTQQRKRVCLTRPIPLTKCSKPLANLLSLKQRSYSRLRHRIHLRPNKSARHGHKSSRGTTRHARKRYALSVFHKKLYAPSLPETLTCGKWTGAGSTGVWVLMCAPSLALLLAVRQPPCPNVLPGTTYGLL